MHQTWFLTGAHEGLTSSNHLGKIGGRISLREDQSQTAVLDSSRILLKVTRDIL